MGPEVKCFHVDAGKPCTRYLEGALAEREACAKLLAVEVLQLISKGEHDEASIVARCAQKLRALPGSIGGTSSCWERKDESNE